MNGGVLATRKVSIRRPDPAIPFLTNSGTAIRAKNWVLIGDAAGHADPITGEGILYALWSGELAVDAIHRNTTKSFDTRWRAEYGHYLIERCKQREIFYNPTMIEL